MNIWDWRVTATAGAMLWGGWALYVNWEAGPASATLSALTQATVSASSITLLSLLANRVLSMRWPNKYVQVFAGTVIPYSVLLSLVASAHLMVGTRNIILTMLPSASIGIVYTALYATKNRRRFAPSVQPLCQVGESSSL